MLIDSNKFETAGTAVHPDSHGELDGVVVMVQWSRNRAEHDHEIWDGVQIVGDRESRVRTRVLVVVMG